MKQVVLWLRAGTLVIAKVYLGKSAQCDRSMKYEKFNHLLKLLLSCYDDVSAAVFLIVQALLTQQLITMNNCSFWVHISLKSCLHVLLYSVFKGPSSGNSTARHRDIRRAMHGHQVAVVDEFVYLGALTHSSVLSSYDIHRRSGLTRSATQKSDNCVWKSRLSLSTKLKLYNVCILPIMLYGSECWALSIELTPERLTHWISSAWGGSLIYAGTTVFPTVKCGA